MSKEFIVNCIEGAIDNNWPLRPVKNLRFINIDNENNIELSDKSHVLDSIEDLQNFPPGVTGVAVIPLFIEGFVCLDMDFKDGALKTKIWKLLRNYRKEDLFLRYGNLDKMGQFWFKCDDFVQYCSYPGIDIITTQKRCDAIGQYKNEDDFYEWPYKNIWDFGPDDLPIISSELVTEILEVTNNALGNKTVKGKHSGGRHDALLEIAKEGFSKNKRINDILRDLFSSAAYKDLSKSPRKKNEDPSKEIQRIMSWGASESAKSFVEIIKRPEEKDSSIFDMIPSYPPEVERKSFFDMLFRVNRRNQPVDNKLMALATTLSVCGWLCSLGIRYRGFCPNLMILFVCPPGGGKSTGQKMLDQIMAIEPKLNQSYRGKDIRTTASLYQAVQESPILYYNIDEASKLFKNTNNSSSHVSDLPEVISQLYSDFADNVGPSVLARTKSETYGVAVGPRMNLLATSTPHFWESFNVSNFTQGLGRRMFMIVDDSLNYFKKNFGHSESFFTKKETKLINLFIRSYIGKDEIFDNADIKKYKISKRKEFINGLEKNIEFKSCKKSKINNVLTETKEVTEYLQNDFIEKSNKIKKYSYIYGTDIQQYIANSRPEFVFKLAAIYTVCCKKMAIDFEVDEIAMDMATQVDMQAIKWAEQMFDYYLIGQLTERLDGIYNRTQNVDKKHEDAEKFYEFLIDKKIEKIKKSDNRVKNFFMRKIKGGVNMRDQIIIELVERGKLNLNKDKISDRGCVIEVVK